MHRPILLLLLFANSVAVAGDVPIVTKRNISYREGSTDRLSALDVYAPKDAKDAPVMVWVHGGGWQIGDKARMNAKLPAFPNRGWVIVSVNYRLVPKVRWAEQASDIAAALAWVHAKISKHGGSAKKIFLMGHSAGAHLAALVATDPRYLKAHKLSPTMLSGVVLLDGAGYDIKRQLELAGERGKKLYKTVFGEKPEQLKAASPITHVKKEHGTPPMRIFYVAWRRASRLQSEALAKKLKAAGADAVAIPARRKTHATINREFGKKDDLVTRQAFEFFEKQLKAGK